MSANHLGHLLHEDGTLDHDIRAKRGDFISRTVEIGDLFHFASPVEILTATDIYCADYYGSLAGWDLGGPAAQMFFNAWTTNVKLAWAVPRSTRTFLVQQVLALGLTSARTEVLARFIKFFSSLCSAPSHEVRTVVFLSARDRRSITGRNLAFIAKLLGEDPWTVDRNTVRLRLREQEKVEPDPTDCWRSTYLMRLLETQQFCHFNGLTEDESNISDLIDSLCKG